MSHLKINVQSPINLQIHFNSKISHSENRGEEIVIGSKPEAVGLQRYTKMAKQNQFSAQMSEPSAKFKCAFGAASPTKEYFHVLNKFRCY